MKFDENLPTRRNRSLYFSHIVVKSATRLTYTYHISFTEGRIESYFGPDPQIEDFGKIGLDFDLKRPFLQFNIKSTPRAFILIAQK